MPINVKINGKPETFEQPLTIEELLKLKKIRKEVVTIELNDNILEREKYAATILKDGDRMEFVYYMGGGAVVSENVLELIGNTPLIKLNKLGGGESAQIFAKLESFNPGGSIKDRTA